MNGRLWLRILCLAAVGAHGLFASAFAVNELGARAQGMGGAFCSIASDASAIFFNPAGMAFIPGTNFQMDNLVVAGQFRFIPSDAPVGTVVPAKGFSGATSQPFIPIASLYFTHRINPRITVGFGGYTPFGLAANFTNFNDGDPANTKFVGRFAGTRAGLQAYWLQPTVSIRLADSQAIAIGIAYVHTHLFLEQSFFNPLEPPTPYGLALAREIFPGVDPDQAYRSFARLLPEGRLRAAATANAPAFSAGYMLKNKRTGFNVGLMMRSAVVHHLKGRAAFSFTNTGAIEPFLPKDRSLATQFPNQDISGTFTTPATYVVGISNSRVWRGTLAFDVRFQDFQRFKDFPINFSQTTDAKGRPIGVTPERRLNFDFRNSVLLQIGFEKALAAGWGPRRMQPMLKDFTWRAGYVFDYTPVVDKSVGPLFPDANRHSWTAGMTKRAGKVDLTMFYQFMQFVNRTTNVPENNYQFTNGQYRNFAHLAGAGLQWRFGKQDGAE